MPATNSTKYTGPASVVVTGRDHGYAVEVFEFDTVKAAREYAQEIGDCYVVFGTQMWNEPLGQVEESEDYADSEYVA